MRESTDKPKTISKDTFTITEVGTLFDQLRGEFKVFGERQEAIVEKVDATFEQVGRNTEKSTLIESAIKNMAVDIKRLTESIDKLIKIKVDREDFLALERRMDVLEAKVESLSK